MVHIFNPGTVTNMFFKAGLTSYLLPCLIPTYVCHSSDSACHATLTQYFSSSHLPLLSVEASTVVPVRNLTFTILLLRASHLYGVEGEGHVYIY